LIRFRPIAGMFATINLYLKHTKKLRPIETPTIGRTMPKKILLIENDDEMRELMRTILEQNGYEVAIAADGVRGYDMALFIKPDVIVTDIRLPGADGIHVVRRVRDTSSLAQTPILVTTPFGTGTGTFALQLGANALEPMPIDPRSLLITVRRLLKLRKSKRAA
jgi:DNA-binding response OmpR family regulator